MFPLNLSFLFGMAGQWICEGIEGGMRERGGGEVEKVRAERSQE